jgi:peptide/nickel transport system substrate-binding protein
VIVPRVMDFALQVEPMPYDPAKTKQLLAEAGYPNGIDGGEFAAIPGFPTIAESVMNYLNAAGIRVKLRQMERAAFYADWQAKKLRGVFMTGAGNSGNAASRVEAFIQSKGPYAYGGYPDIDELFRQQATERDQAKRQTIVYKIQQLSIDRVMYAPVLDFAALMGIGPRVTKHTITDVWMSPFPSYEDLEIKG